MDKIQVKTNQSKRSFATAITTLSHRLDSRCQLSVSYGAFLQLFPTKLFSLWMKYGIGISNTLNVASSEAQWSCSYRFNKTTVGIHQTRRWSATDYHDRCTWSSFIHLFAKTGRCSYVFTSRKKSECFFYNHSSAEYSCLGYQSRWEIKIHFLYISI